MASDVIKRGDIYRVNLEPTLGSEQQGRARPCVVLSITPFNKQFKTVGVVPLSSSARVHEPVTVSVPSAGEGAVALCYQLRTIDKARLLKPMGELAAADMAAIEVAVKQVYGLN
ncbi:MazF Growth inhibitor [Burkholderiaceae bacterium]|jgi:mRNA interferase MazF